jgi:hypothetical protein
VALRILNDFAKQIFSTIGRTFLKKNNQKRWRFLDVQQPSQVEHTYDHWFNILLKKKGYQCWLFL